MSVRRYTTLLLNLGANCRMVRFTPRPIYCRYLPNSWLGEFQSQSGCSGEKKNLLFLPGIKP